MQACQLDSGCLQHSGIKHWVGEQRRNRFKVEKNQLQIFHSCIEGEPLARVTEAVTTNLSEEWFIVSYRKWSCLLRLITILITVGIWLRFCHYFASQEESWHTVNFKYVFSCSAIPKVKFERTFILASTQIKTPLRVYSADTATKL